MEVELIPANWLAWDLFWTARQESGVGNLLLSLQTILLTEEEASDTADKVRCLSSEIMEIEARQAEEERRNNARTSPRR